MAARLIRNDSATVPTAMLPINFSGKRSHRPKMPLIAAPASGSNGTSQMYLFIDCRGRARPCPISLSQRRAGDKPCPYKRSPFHQINLIYPDRFAIAIKRDHDTQSDGRFSGGDDDNKHGEYLPGHGITRAGVLQVTRESNEVQVRGV